MGDNCGMPIFIMLDEGEHKGDDTDAELIGELRELSEPEGVIAFLRLFELVSIKCCWSVLGLLPVEFIGEGMGLILNGFVGEGELAVALQYALCGCWGEGCGYCSVMLMN